MEWFRSSFAYWPTTVEQPTQTRIRTNVRHSHEICTSKRNNNGSSVNGNGAIEHIPNIKKLSFSSWFSHLLHFHSFTHSLIWLRLCVWLEMCEHLVGAHIYTRSSVTLAPVGATACQSNKMPTAIQLCVKAMVYAHSKLPKNNKIQRLD